MNRHRCSPDDPAPVRNVVAHVVQRLTRTVLAAAMLSPLACQTADDEKCEVACHCRNDAQYREAGYCDREVMRCASGEEVCEELCADDGGVDQLCSSAGSQPWGHVAPELVCPGADPVGEDCGPIADCRVDGRGSAGGLGLALIGVLAAWRRRRSA